MPYNKLFPLQSLNLQFFSEPNDPPANTPADPPQEPKTFSEEYVQQLRDEAAKYRTKAKNLETTTQQTQQEMMKKVFDMFGLEPDPNKEFEKQLSDAQAKAQEAEQKANDKLIRSEIKSVGVDLNIVDPEAAYVLLDKEGLRVADNGEVEGVKDALEKLIEAKPYLVNQTTDPEPNQQQTGNYKPGRQQKNNNNASKDDGYQAGVQAYQALKEKKRIRK
jgi:hypothetical protein